MIFLFFLLEFFIIPALPLNKFLYCGVIKKIKKFIIYFFYCKEGQRPRIFIIFVSKRYDLLLFKSQTSIHIILTKML